MNIIIKLSLFLVIISIFGSCDKDEAAISTDNINVTITNSEVYKHDFMISGDEEGAIIKTQAQNFQKSELIRDSSTNWSVVYEYKPLSNYAGTDYVEIETCTGGEGVGCSNIEIVRINFTITN